MLGLNPVAIVKAELLKHKDKEGVPIVIDLIEALEKDLGVVAQYSKLLDASDIKAVFELLPEKVKAKVPAGAVEALADAIISLPITATKAQAALVNLEAQLKQ